MKTLNEEIERMKSLFSEERLYGNLVEKDGEDPFSKKSIRKSASIQRKQDRVIAKNTKDTKKQKEKDIRDNEKEVAKNRRIFAKYCVKQVGTFHKLFIDKKVRLDSKSGDEKTDWNTLLQTTKPKGKNIKNEDTTFDSYKDLFTQCKNAGFNDEEISNLDTYGVFPSLDNLIYIVDTDIDVADRNERITTKKDDSSKDDGENVANNEKDNSDGKEEKDNTNYKKIKPETFKTSEGFDGGELKVIGKNKFKIIPKGSYRPVDNSTGKRDYQNHKIRSEFEEGIKNTLITLRNNAKSNNIELKTDGNIKFVDNYVFEIV